MRFGTLNLLAANTEGCYDVVVVGGGPAGAAAALILARARRRVLLVEESTGPPFKIGEALPPAARQLLREFGLLESFIAQDHLPSYGNLSAWGSSELRSTDFIFDPNGAGWHLDRPRFDQLLRNAALEAGADVSIGARLNIKTCQYSCDSWSISVGSNGSEQKLRSRWLMDATGRRSAVARSQGVRRWSDDRLVAFFAVFSPREYERVTDQDSRTLIEAAPDGWWYTALLPSRDRVVVYLTDADAAPESVRSKEGFLMLLRRSKHISACLDEYAYAMRTGVKAAPANSARLESFTGEGWMAVGDAAASFDPLSSQGILTALFTGMKAAETLNDKLSDDSKSLSKYEERVSAIYNVYLQNRSTYYQQEQRWMTRPFWQRRHRKAAETAREHRGFEVHQSRAATPLR